MPARLPKIQWSKRGKVTRSELSTRKRWASEGGHYAIDHVKFNFADMSPEWQLFGGCPGCSVLVKLSSHRTRGGAEKAANKHRNGNLA